MHLAAVFNEPDTMVERIFADYTDTLFPTMPEVDNEGFLAVPTAPGLGYEVDVEALARCEIQPSAPPLSIPDSAKL